MAANIRILWLRPKWQPSNFVMLSSFSSSNQQGNSQQEFSTRSNFINDAKSDARRILEVLYQDGPGFDTKTALDDLQVRLSGLLVREVLVGILKTLNYADKSRCAKMGYKFFLWSGQHENYKHTANSYHLIMKIFAESEEFKAMWRLVDEMIEKGYSVTARTLNILICTCGEAGLARKVVEKFIKAKVFNYRPFKHSFNAILHSLLTVKQYRLIEWVYQQMLDEGHTPDMLTYNILLCAKYRLGKLDQFHRLLDEMGRNGFSPDFHTFNILLHVLGKWDKPLAALNLLNHMNEVGYDPSILHFTTLIDGLSRAGNLDACKYFFDRMIKQGIVPDVVCYTVMITVYVMAGELDKAKELFSDMVNKGQLPNAFTYNSMIRGLCMSRKFEEACLMLKEMESKGRNPNFLVYSTLVKNLQNAGKLLEADRVVRYMVEKGCYMPLVSKIRKYKRC
nr:pentatricopeptide repeat-containing protein At3g60050-like isoform X1 [Ipomoea batatas]GMD61853.1 pentatricopeptide repeat-containing protein At3g60050-like isoform X1 [Ipomoea batatas]GME15033.1 pentatricopeptide repeat-containing protein At3g60050-like isoform X1 [Ipomoea batatas]